MRCQAGEATPAERLAVRRAVVDYTRLSRGDRKDALKQLFREHTDNIKADPFKNTPNNDPKANNNNNNNNSVAPPQKKPSKPRDQMGEIKDTKDRRGLTKKEHRQLDTLEQLRFTDPGEREVALVSQALTLCPLPFRKPVGNKVERQVQIPGGVLDVVFTFTGKKGKGSLAYGNDAVLLDLLCSEARLKKSPEVTFDRAYELLELLGIKSDGGSVYADLKKRLVRLSTLHIYVERRGEVAVNLRVVDISNLRVPSQQDLKRENAGEKPLIPYAIRFSPEFFADLMGNYVPLPHAVVMAFKGSPVEYSLAKWLVHRIHIAKGESLVAWDDLQAERGSVDSNMDRFKLKTQNVIKKLWEAWPEITAAVTRERGGLRIKPPKAKLL